MKAMAYHRPLGSITSWMGKGFWVAMDQGLFAGSNFMLNILLARWLLPQDYGAFAIAYSIFILFGAFHTAMLTEPMLVFGSGKYKERFSSYLGILLRGHWGMTAIIGVLLAFVGFVFWLTSSNPIGPILFSLALASPFILFQWLMRRACYVSLEPKLAAYAGAIYMALMLFGAYLLYAYDLLNKMSAFGVMAIASFASAIWLMYRLGAHHRSPPHDSSLVQESFKDHWNYGSWAVGASILALIPWNIYFFLLYDLEATGALRALLNFLLPIWLINSALGSILIPTFVKVRGTADFARSVIVSSSLLAVIAFLYTVILLSNSESIMNFLYGGRYDSYSSILWIFLPLLIPSAFISVLGAGLQALEKPNYVFYACLLNAVSALTQGILLTMLWGLKGVVISFWINSSLAMGLITWLFFSALRRERR